MTFIRSLAIALAFIVPASYTLAVADEAPKPEKKEGKKHEKKEKKDEGAAK